MPRNAGGHIIILLQSYQEQWTLDLASGRDDQSMNTRPAEGILVDAHVTTLTLLFSEASACRVLHHCSEFPGRPVGSIDEETS